MRCGILKANGRAILLRCDVMEKPKQISFRRDRVMCSVNGQSEGCLGAKVHWERDRRERTTGQRQQATGPTIEGREVFRELREPNENHVSHTRSNKAIVSRRQYVVVKPVFPQEAGKRVVGEFRLIACKACAPFPRQRTLNF